MYLILSFSISFSKLPFVSFISLSFKAIFASFGILGIYSSSIFLRLKVFIHSFLTSLFIVYSLPFLPINLKELSLGSALSMKKLSPLIKSLTFELNSFLASCASSLSVLSLILSINSLADLSKSFKLFILLNPLRICILVPALLPTSHNLIK
ncbi:putative membrane protein [Campylobacter jejuni subsp. jejuni 305]|nr:putative membrane protein [Campylobacter jejuni subsp. jejuni 305]